MKYLICKGTGGLVHMLNGIQASVELSIKENRILIIDTEQLKSFLKNFHDYFFIYDKNLVYYTDYENIDKNLIFKGLPISEIICKKAKFNPKDGKYYLEETDIRIQKDIDGNIEDDIRICAGHSNNFIKNIRLNNDKLYKVFDSVNPLIENYKKYISVHFRNTDMKNSINDFIECIRKTSIEYNVNDVFIATDDYYAFNVFKKFLPNINFFRISEPNNFNGENIHYNSVNKDELIMNTLKDIYVIIKSTYFIPSFNSGISKWIIYQKNNPEYTMFDDDYLFKIIY